MTTPPARRTAFLLALLALPAGAGLPLAGAADLAVAAEVANAPPRILAIDVAEGRVSVRVADANGYDDVVEVTLAYARLDTGVACGAPEPARLEGGEGAEGRWSAPLGCGTRAVRVSVHAEDARGDAASRDHDVTGPQEVEVMSTAAAPPRGLLARAFSLLVLTAKSLVGVVFVP